MTTYIFLYGFAIARCIKVLNATKVAYRSIFSRTGLFE